MGRRPQCEFIDLFIVESDRELRRRSHHCLFSAATSQARSHLFDALPAALLLPLARPLVALLEQLMAVPPLPSQSQLLLPSILMPRSKHSP